MSYDDLVKGCDVSHWNGTINWPKMADDGVAFAYIKVDAMFEANATAADSAGIFTLAYAFMGEMPVDEFNARIGNMAAVLDCETAGIESAVAGYLAGRFSKPTLAYVGIYPPFTPPDGLWVLPRILPEYASAPRLPAWDGVSTPDWQNQWLIWQRSSTEQFQGETGNFDLDVLAVSLDQFKNWCATGNWIASPGA